VVVVECVNWESNVNRTLTLFFKFVNSRGVGGMVCGADPVRKIKKQRTKKCCFQIPSTFGTFARYRHPTKEVGINVYNMYILSAKSTGRHAIVH
jgi:hypothetical protein